MTKVLFKHFKENFHQDIDKAIECVDKGNLH